MPDVRGKLCGRSFASFQHIIPEINPSCGRLPNKPSRQSFGPGSAIGAIVSTARLQPPVQFVMRTGRAELVTIPSPSRSNNPPRTLLGRNQNGRSSGTSGKPRTTRGIGSRADPLPEHNPDRIPRPVRPATKAANPITQARKAKARANRRSPKAKLRSHILHRQLNPLLRPLQQSFRLGLRRAQPTNTLLPTASPFTATQASESITQKREVVQALKTAYPDMAQMPTETKDLITKIETDIEKLEKEHSKATMKNLHSATKALGKA